MYYVVTNNPNQAQSFQTAELAIGYACHLDFMNEHGGKIEIINDKGFAIDFLSEGATVRALGPDKSNEIQ